MKKVLKKIAVWLPQLTVFYILPLFAGPTDIMGLVLVMLFSTFVLSLVCGVFVKKKRKVFYPVITAILFLPSVFLYYNESALVHALWYLTIACIGIVIGTMLRREICSSQK
jgi:hypothetical protein